MAEKQEKAQEAPFRYPEREIKLERARMGEANYEVVSINGKRWQIMRGVPVRVPYEVYALLRDQGAAMETAQEFLEGNTTNL